MGKSPGKWLKRLFFGKKLSSKSTSQKAISFNNVKKAATPEKEAAVGPKTPPIGDMSMSSFTVPDMALQSSSTSTGKKTNENENMEKTIFLDLQTEQLEQAATTAQAIFRGYLARRSFGALKGLIRLQALIRGHLNRRQAIATLCCVHGIVRLQALFRGKRVRLSDVGCQVHKKCSTLNVTRVGLSRLCRTPRPDKLSSSAFISKLIASSKTAKPLHLQYDPMEPNCAWQWLERWSSSNFWEPLPQLKHALETRSYMKQGKIKTKETELGRPKQVDGRASTVKNKKLSLHPSLAFEKQINKSRKLEFKEESEPQNDLERVKQNLRRISASSKVAFDCSESVVDTQKLTPNTVSIFPTSEVSEKTVDKFLDTISKSSVAVSENSIQSQVEMPPNPNAMEKKLDKLQDDHVVVKPSPMRNLDGIENALVEDETTNFKEDKTSKGYQRSNKSNFPTKVEYPDSVSQRSPSLPNYMAATESAKAKLRGLEFSRFDQNETENGGFVRRHSLPLYTGGKSSLMSERTERLVQASSRGESRYLLSSTDGHGKGARPGWRR
ncbi:IQ motif, EF-hand binding site [Trema orientale]|uniref:IQ motif, EF-hand binding site n=1 Tax=Trema orientale TaxID=63057 RepID=A0A2P5FDN3_TREOI|nr:IQ motif, EF-hand binding site [Trema orientale]